MNRLCIYPVIIHTDNFITLIKLYQWCIDYCGSGNNDWVVAPIWPEDPQQRVQAYEFKFSDSAHASAFLLAWS